jgi:hypothetical protein
MDSHDRAVPDRPERIPMLRRRLRLLACTTALLLVAAAFAQQPVQSPNYLLSSAPSLELGVPVGGALTPASGRNFKDGSYLDVLILRAKAGEGVEVLVESDAFDTYLSVFDPVGSLIASNDDVWEVSSAPYASQVAFEAALTGAYVVVVSGFSPTDLGAYTVTRVAWEAPEPVLVDVAGPGIFRGTVEPGMVVGYRFALDAPATLTATARSLEFDTVLRLVVDGVVVAENDDFDGTDSQIVVDLEAGDYVVEVAGYWEGAFGAFGLDLDW